MKPKAEGDAYHEASHYVVAGHEGASPVVATSRKVILGGAVSGEADVRISWAGIIGELMYYRSGAVPEDKELWRLGSRKRLMSDSDRDPIVACGREAALPLAREAERILRESWEEVERIAGEILAHGIYSV